MEKTNSVLEGLYIYIGDVLGNPGVNSITGCPAKTTADVMENCFGVDELIDIQAITRRNWTAMNEIDFNDWSQFAIDQLIEECRGGNLALEHTNVTPAQIADAVEYLVKEL